MELQQLKYFLTVAQMGHMTRAAESLYISQPALSRSIKRLEEELGISLLKKNGRGIALTEYGEHFYIHVKRIFSELSQAEAERDDLLDHNAPPIRLGSTIPGITLPVLESYHGIRPDAPILHEAMKENGQLLERISEGGVDLGFCDAMLFPSNIDHHTIWNDQLYAVLPKKHPLSSEHSLRFEDLLSQTLILSNSEGSLWDLIVSFNHGTEPKSLMHAANMPEALRLCVLGYGITVTSGFFLDIQIQESMHDGKSMLDFAVPVPIEGCAWEISLVWKKQDYYRKQLQHFLDHTIAYYQNRSETSILQSIIKKETR